MFSTEQINKTIAIVKRTQKKLIQTKNGVQIIHYS